MTGFGTSKGLTDRSEIDVTVRSVNGRFFEWKANLPQRLMPLEPQLKRLVQNEFERGTVTLLMIERIRPGDSTKAPSINLKRAKLWHSSLQEMKKVLKLSGDISLDHVLRGSDLFLEETSQELTATEQGQILRTFKKALNHCQAERNREGLSIRNDLHKNTRILLKLTTKLQDLREAANQNLKTLFAARLKKLGLEIPLNSAHLNTEVALLIEKSDINEEINRLVTHLQRFDEILDGKVAQGKKLDFYVQELLREVNTVGSKSSIPDMTETVVEMKTVIERLREQVQNIE